MAARAEALGLNEGAATGVREKHPLTAPMNANDVHKPINRAEDKRRPVGRGKRR